jgi:murein DD-endopeptidase MepM/ murein hydrolase activator NlpD
MARWLLVIALYGVLFGAGWIVGTFYPAPPAIAGPIAQNAPGIASRLGLDELDMERLRGMLSEEDYARLRDEASALAAEAGQAITVERDEEALRGAMANVEGVALAPPEAAPIPVAFGTTLSLCPRMSVSNAPPANAQGQVRNYAPVVSVNGVRIAVNPTSGACLSSAVGPRGSGQHKGLDFHAATGGPIFAAGDGVVIERKYRDDYGNMLLIDHGGGVYTRYAHLSSFSDDVLVGMQVRAGQQIGLMGNTAAYAIPIHLHYEVLLGDYNTPRQSFGLEARSPFTFAAAN